MFLRKASPSFWSDAGEFLGSVAFDEAFVEGNPPSTDVPSGNVTFFVYSNDHCLGTASSQVAPLLGPIGNTDTAVSDSADLGPLAAGTYSYRAEYAGDDTFAGSTGPCEPFTVVPAPIHLTVTLLDAGTNQPLGGDAAAGSSVAPAIQLGNVPGFIPGGTLSIDIFNHNRTCGGTPDATQEDPVSSDGTVPRPVATSPLGPGDHSIKVSYPGDKNYQPGQSCAPFVVARAPCPDITLTPPSLPSAAPGSNYSQQLSAASGAAPYSFSIAGGTLPPGLTLDPTGLIHGTATTTGSYHFTVRVTDTNGCPGTHAYTIDVFQLSAPPCKCQSIKAFINHVFTFGTGSTRIEFAVNWRLTCTAGAGRCKGKLLIRAPRQATFLNQNGKTLRPAKPTIVAVNCAGPCAATTAGHETLQYLALTTVTDRKGHKHALPVAQFTPEGRAGKTFHIKLSLSCLDQNGVPGFPTVLTLSLAFNKRGNVDYANSDLNGDGRADRGQLR